MYIFFNSKIIFSAVGGLEPHWYVEFILQILLFVIKKLHLDNHKSSSFYMPTGIVKFSHRKKGFGFIRYEDSETEIFVHATGIVEKKTIQDNVKVTFDVKESDKGPIAVNVKKI